MIGDDNSSSGAVEAALAKYATVVMDSTGKFVDFAQKALHWTFLPTLIFIGIRITEPKPHLMQILIPTA
eukprot:CAMPEP_0184016466 /NCGR_PEP_ID=MMETSP0954-20121128/6944_1 /TAXON_ID=627963 /ORGANISM="Aplanochytrium sp, Strain PBS07" /LENGTH=68 /DNA_ID=CAMNT_0026297489 /DNA_START=109 /DNA_END=315 /DNA_ORIENTATION=+